MKMLILFPHHVNLTLVRTVQERVPNVAGVVSNMRTPLARVISIELSSHFFPDVFLDLYISTKSKNSSRVNYKKGFARNLESFLFVEDDCLLSLPWQITIFSLLFGRNILEFFPPTMTLRKSKKGQRLLA